MQKLTNQFNSDHTQVKLPMTKYFYSDGINKYGPFTFNELVQQEISENTLVWHYPMPYWQSASEIPALFTYFTIPPKALVTKNESGTKEKNGHKLGQLSNELPPKSWLTRAVFVALFCCLPFGVAGIIYAVRSEACFKTGDIEGAKKASKQASQWTITGLVMGIILALIYLVVHAW